MKMLLNFDRLCAHMWNESDYKQTQATQLADLVKMLIV